MLFNATGDRLVGTLVGTSQIASFAVLPNGRLRAAPGSPFPGQGLGQIGAEFRPTNPSQLFVTNAHNGAGLGTVSAFSDSSSGQLSPIGSSPYPDFQTAPCWVEISHDGQYLFAVNTGSDNISSYSINPDGSLVLIGSHDDHRRRGLTSTPGCPRTASTCWSTAPAAISCPCSRSTAAPSPSCPAPDAAARRGPSSAGIVNT